MVRFNRSMNNVFNVEESSELLSASSNRHVAPCSALLSTLMIRSFLRVLPPSSVGEMTLRLYGALNYSQNSIRDLRFALNGA